MGVMTKDELVAKMEEARKEASEDSGIETSDKNEPSASHPDPVNLMDLYKSGDRITLDGRNFMVSRVYARKLYIKFVG